jgi:mannose-1-phosphate guanylyltransferase
MKAMVLAAGLGTRLLPLTETRPKALVEVAGETMLAITLARLRSFGIVDVIVNVHHFSEMVIDYLRANDNFGMHIAISQEENLLDTGGGLKRAAWFLLNDLQGDGEPFVLYNVDVISTIDLQRMAQFHTASHALATLAVRDRETSRALLFDGGVELCGRVNRGHQAELVRKAATPVALAFSGIHVISPAFFSKMSEEGAFSIITSYLRLAACEERIVAYRDDESYWSDLGRPESLERAAQARRNWIGSGYSPAPLPNGGRVHQCKKRPRRETTSNARILQVEGRESSEVWTGWQASATVTVAIVPTVVSIHSLPVPVASRAAQASRPAGG